MRQARTLLTKQIWVIKWEHVILLQHVQGGKSVDVATLKCHAGFQCLEAGRMRGCTCIVALKSPVSLNRTKVAMSPGHRTGTAMSASRLQAD